MSFGSEHTSRASHVQSITVSLIQLATFRPLFTFRSSKKLFAEMRIRKKKIIFLFHHKATSDTGPFSPLRHATDFADKVLKYFVRCFYLFEFWTVVEFNSWKFHLSWKFNEDEF